MKKSKYKVLALALLLIGIPIVGNVYAIEENHQDWSFSFQLGRANFTQYTSSRPKLEKTPIYCEIKRINVSKSLKLAAVRGDTSESTYTPITYVTEPGIYYLSSNIREDYEKWKTPQLQGSEDKNIILLVQLMPVDFGRQTLISELI